MKKNFGTKLLSFLLAVMLLVGTVPAVAMEAFAADVNEAGAEITEKVKMAAASYSSGDYEYAILEDGTAKLTRYTGGATEFVVPSELNGRKVTQIGSNPFLPSARMKSILIPASITFIESDSFDNCTNLTEIKVSPENLHYSSSDGVLFDKFKTKLVRYPISKSNVNYEVPNSVIFIGENAFKNSSYFTTVKIPNSVTTIGSSAFECCHSLIDIVIPSSVTSIGDRLFYHCSYLESVVNNSNTNRIGRSMFYECYLLKNVTIPKSIIAIDDYAFFICRGLTSISFSNELLNIGGSAFYGCESLTDIYYSGTPEQWSKVVVNENYNNPLFSATIHYNSYIPPKENAKNWCNSLNIIYASGDNANSVTQNVTLNKNNPYGLRVQWSSSNPSIVSPSGAVTRPLYDTPVQVYVNVYFGSDEATGASYSYYKKFDIVVKGTKSATPPNPIEENRVQIEPWEKWEIDQFFDILTKDMKYTDKEANFYSFYRLLSGAYKDNPLYEDIVKSAFLQFCYACIDARIKHSEYKINFSETMLTQWLESKGGESALVQSVVDSSTSMVKDVLKESALIAADVDLIELPDGQDIVGNFVDWSFTLTNIIGGISAIKENREMIYLAEYLEARKNYDDFEYIDVILSGIVAKAGLGEKDRTKLEWVGEQIHQIEKSLGAEFKKTYTAKCPVVMEVYDGSGNLVAVLDNDSEGALVNPYGSFSIIKEPGTDDYIKVARLYDDNCYIKLKGVGEGNMNLTVEEKDENGDSTYYRTDIPVTETTEVTVISGEEAPNMIIDDTADITEDTAIEMPEVIPEKRTVSAAAEIGGFVLGGGSYEIGSEIILSAYPEKGYEFTGWYKNGELVSKENAFAVTVTEDCEYIAMFVPFAADITLSQTEATLKFGGKFTLTATVTPDNAFDKSVTWSSSNPDVASVDENGNVVAKKAGTAVITATTANGLTATCEVTVENIAAESVVLSQSVATLKVGGKFTLTATVTPDNAFDKSVTWSSSNPDVAAVDENGNVTAKKAGTAVITATTANGLTATCEVTVENIEAESIVLSQSVAILKVGGKFTLTATVTPDNAFDKSVTWSSSNPDVASVDENGNVVAKRAGTAVITATTANGLTASCEVTVENIAAESIVLSQSEATLKVGGKFTLTAAVTPDNAFDKSVTWSSSNPDVAAVDENGNVTAKKAGTAVITATTANGLTATCEVKVEAATLKIVSGGADTGDVFYVKLPSIWMQYKSHYTTLGFVLDSDAEIASVKWSYANWSNGNPEANIESPDSPVTVIRPNGRGIGARSTWITLTVTDVYGNVYQDTVKVRFYKWSWQVH